MEYWSNGESVVFTAAVFDLYGTLVCYLPSEDYAQCHSDIASVLGVPDDSMAKVWRESFGNRYSGRFPSYEDCLTDACRSLGADVPPERIAEATHIRLELMRRNLRPRNGAVEALSSLRSAGVRLGLVSDCAPEVSRLWHETEFAGLIDVPIFSPDAGTTKPDSRIYMLACDRLGVQPEECLYVGDGGSHELSGARAVGMHPILLRSDDDGAHVPKRPDAAGWDGPVITDLRQICSCWKEM